MSWFEFSPCQIQGLILGSLVKENRGTKIHFIFWESPNQLSAPVLLAALEESKIRQHSGESETRVLQESAGGEVDKRARAGGLEQAAAGLKRRGVEDEAPERKDISRRKNPQNMHDSASNSHP